MMKGCSRILRATWESSCQGEPFSSPDSAIIIGAMAKCRMFSKQKISATGTAASGPKASNARPAPM